MGGGEVTDIDKVLADHRESTMPAWKGACAADGDDFPCLEYRLASELEAARTEATKLREALEELVEAHDYWFSTGMGEARAIAATVKAKGVLG